MDKHEMEQEIRKWKSRFCWATGYALGVTITMIWNIYFK